MLNCEILLFLLFSVNDPKNIYIKNTLLLNQPRYNGIQSPLQFTSVFVHSDFLLFLEKKSILTLGNTFFLSVFFFFFFAAKTFATICEIIFLKKWGENNKIKENVLATYNWSKVAKVPLANGRAIWRPPLS
jgi:hypothetical protein